jgi:type IV secretory pathway VirD2 relaxase
LKIVATTAKERASSQSYGPKHKAIVEAADRPRPAREARDRAYVADPLNQRLIDNARQGSGSPRPIPSACRCPRLTAKS